QTLGKLATDICLYSSQNFGFVRLPDELTTGSSIMPHKKNPDVFELVRGRCNLLMSLPTQISQLLGNQPSGYHRDFQLLKEAVFPALNQLDDILAIVDYALPKMEVFGQELKKDDRYRYLYSVEAVNAQVLKGTPFRDAYQQIGRAIERGEFDPPKELNHTHLGSLGNLANAQIRTKLDGVLQGFNFSRAELAITALLKD
ncbi:MAG: lyase family protein, partial [Bacteroidota bacterium]